MDYARRLRMPRLREPPGGKTKAAAKSKAIAKASTNESPLALISRARSLLKHARSAVEVLKAKDMAAAALHLAKLTRATNETHADCVRTIVLAESLVADQVDAAQERGELARKDRHPGSVRSSDTEQPATLDEVGIKRQRLIEWRRRRDAGSEVIEEAIKEALDHDRAPTLADVDRKIKEKRGGKTEATVMDFRANAAQSTSGGTDVKAPLSPVRQLSDNKPTVTRGLQESIKLAKNNPPPVKPKPEPEVTEARIKAHRAAQEQSDRDRESTRQRIASQQEAMQKPDEPPLAPEPETEQEAEAPQLSEQSAAPMQGDFDLDDAERNLIALLRYSRADFTLTVARSANRYQVSRDDANGSRRGEGDDFIEAWNAA
jgi:hypothetical protein